MSLTFEDRKKDIMSKLERDGKVGVPELAELFNVSSETIRRDLDRLDKEGLLKKVYGGAVKSRSYAIEPPFDQKTILHPGEKDAIGALAASLVSDGDSIMLGNGTTPLAMIRHLAQRKNVTLVTHSVPVLLAAMEQFGGRLIFIGGEVNVHQRTASGPLAELALKQLKVNKTFISAGGITQADGITDYDLYEAHIARQMAERSEALIVLADHSKLGKSTLAHICPLKSISALVTDAGCSAEWRELLDENGVELLIAGTVEEK